MPRRTAGPGPDRRSGGMKSAMGSWLIMGLNVLLLGGSCFS
ncbi:MAG: hypothetical protein R3F16_10790 [Myxococcota bacterium]